MPRRWRPWWAQVELWLPSVAGIATLLKWWSCQ